MARRPPAKIYLPVKEIPPKINEIISYLSMEFSKNQLFDRDDLAQDLYLDYFSALHDNPSLTTAQAGWWFIRFKWYLLTKWRKRVKQINREHTYEIEQSGVDTNPAVENYESEKKPKKKTKKTKYCF